MRVIDFRLRPPLRSYLGMAQYADIERSKGLARQFGVELPPSAAEMSIDKLFEEMNEAGIEKGVMPGRCSPVFGYVSNDDVAAIVRDYPDRFVGYASADPTVWRKAVRETEAALKLGLRGVVLEPGLLASPMHLDDARIYPFYAYCEDKNLPVLFMAGGNAGPDCTYTSPEHIDCVARDFPNLRLISGHGNWPWASQIIHVCYRRPNIWLSPDMYLYNGMPGAREYADAANGFMRERFLFATAYPVMPLRKTVDMFLQLGLRESALDRLLYQNAADLLAATPDYA